MAVQPIRDLNSINDMKNILKNQNERDYMFFLIGINTGLRISDILKLKVKDVKNKTHVLIKEQKTGKPKRFLINSPLQKEVRNYIKNKAEEEFLFQSRKGDNKPISRIQAYRILDQAAQILNLEEIGTHTLRKTFGYWHYQQNKDVAILQDIFNHSSPSVTLRYIGITDDMKDDSMKEFFL